MTSSYFQNERIAGTLITVIQLAWAKPVCFSLQQIKVSNSKKIEREDPKLVEMITSSIKQRQG